MGPLLLKQIIIIALCCFIGILCCLFDGVHGIVQIDRDQFYNGQCQTSPISTNRDTQGACNFKRDEDLSAGFNPGEIIPFPYGFEDLETNDISEEPINGTSDPCSMVYNKAQESCFPYIGKERYECVNSIISSFNDSDCRLGKRGIVVPNLPNCGNMNTTIFVSLVNSEPVCLLNSRVQNDTRQTQITPVLETKVIFEVVKTQIVYNLHENVTMAVEMKIHPTSVCHCPLSPFSKCDENFNNCKNSSNPCINKYSPGLSGTDCALNSFGGARSCSSLVASSYILRSAHRIGRPVSILIQMRAKAWVNYGNSSNPDIREVYNTVWPLVFGPSFREVIKFPVSGAAPFNQFTVEGIGLGTTLTYPGGDWAIESGVPGIHKLARGWNEVNEHDSSKGGWMTFVRGKAVYSKNSMSSNFRVKTQSCENDKFKYDISVHNSSIKPLPTLQSFLSEFGSAIINETAGTLVLEPNSFNNVFVKITTSSKFNVVVNHVTVERFNCTTSAEYLSVIATCNITFTSPPSAVTAALYGEDKVSLISQQTKATTASINQIVDFVFPVGDMTASGYICMPGNLNPMCMKVKIEDSDVVQISDPDWIFNETEAEDSKSKGDGDFGIDFDFGDSSTWADNIFDTFLVFIGIILALIVFIIAVGTLVAMIFYRKQIRNFLDRRTAKRNKTRSYEMLAQPDKEL